MNSILFFCLYPVCIRLSNSAFSVFGSELRTEMNQNIQDSLNINIYLIFILFEEGRGGGFNIKRENVLKSVKSVNSDDMLTVVGSAV